MAPALDLITLHQLPVAIAQPTESVYQQVGRTASVCLLWLGRSESA